MFIKANRERQRFLPGLQALLVVCLTRSRLTLINVIVGTVAGHFGGGALMTVPAQGSPVSAVVTDLSGTGALLKGATTLAATVLSR